MKLRNKQTGEIKAFDEVMREAYKWNNYNSLAELNAEWCDVEEEPKKGTYFINTQGDVQFWDSSSFAYPDDWTKEKLIGNYFETKEEAEKAVEKLKAWKRLKDKGYRVRMNNHVDGMLYLRIWNDTTDAPTPIDKAGGIYKDLDLLFGGEE